MYIIQRVHQLGITVLVPLVLFHTTLTSFCQESVAERPEPQSNNKAIAGPTAGSTYIDLPIPPAISEGDCRLYAVLLSLDEPQARVLDALRLEYLIRSDAIRAGKEPDLWQRSGEVGQSQGLELDGQSAVAGAQLFDHVEQLLGDLRLADDWFFSELGIRLHLPDLDAIERCRQMRKRFVAVQLHVPFPVSCIDLTELRLQLGCDLESDADDRAAIREAEREYEQSRTALAERFWRVAYRAKTEGTVRQGRAHDAIQLCDDGAAGDEQRSRIRQELYRDLNKLNSPVWDLCMRLHRQNDRYLESLAILAPGKAFETLLESYRNAAFPAVYPDEANLSSLLAKISSSEELTPVEREEIVTLATDYRVHHDELSRDMIEHLIQSRKKLCLTYTLGQEMRLELGEFARIWQERIVLSEDTYLTLMNLLRPISKNEFAGEFLAWQDSVLKLRESGPRGIPNF